MTRLRKNDIDTLTENLSKYEEKFKQQTGKSLLEIARHALNMKTPIKNVRTAVVPVTSGLGIIDGFSNTVCGILQYCGIDAFVTDATDVGGMQEAYKKGAKMLFMADDDTCSAFSILGNAYSDNGFATGIGFAAALEEAMKKRKETGARVLVLGLGPVGTAAAEYLQNAGCEVWVHDINQVATKAFTKTHPGIEVLFNPELKCEFDYILDATPVANIIKKQEVSDRTVIAAPGMPLGVEESAASIAQVIHNPLELGIITMYCECIAKMEQQGASNQKEETAHAYVVGL